MPRRSRDTMRPLEREVMLQLIDQKWREHLSEMDYLREGIEPAGHGPTGSAGRLAARRLRDVRAADGGHRRRLRQDRHARPGPGPRAGRRSSRPAWPAPSTSGRRPGAGDHRHSPGPRSRPGARARRSSSPPSRAGRQPTRGRSPRLPRPAPAPGARPDAAPGSQKPTVRTRSSTAPGRNDPCPCGSGKKFKFCHGR